MTLHALVAAPWAAMVAALRMLRVISLSLYIPLLQFSRIITAFMSICKAGFSMNAN